MKNILFKYSQYNVIAIQNQTKVDFWLSYHILAKSLQLTFQKKMLPSSKLKELKTKRIVFFYTSAL